MSVVYIGFPFLIGASQLFSGGQGHMGVGGRIGESWSRVCVTPSESTEGQDDDEGLTIPPVYHVHSQCCPTNLVGVKGLSIFYPHYNPEGSSTLFPNDLVYLVTLICQCTK